MKLQLAVNTAESRVERVEEQVILGAPANLNRVVRLREADKTEVLEFLNKRPVHTVVMTGFIQDNGLDSANNRGKFYGYRGAKGMLEGVALIGHTTLIEACSEDSLQAFAVIARQ